MPIKEQSAEERKQEERKKAKRLMWVGFTIIAVTIILRLLHVL